MSMTAIMALKLVWILCVYVIITLLIPHFVVGKLIRYKNRYERFMLYSMIGNFFVMNLVYILELLHISNTATLIIFTVIPCLAIKIFVEKIPIVEVLTEFWDTLRRIAGGQLKIRALWDQRRPIRVARRKNLRKQFLEVYVKNIPDVLLVLAVIGVVFWLFGYNDVIYWGYKSSDILVHNYWINELSENNIFAAGVYPYGFHCMIYYMHQVFGIDTYIMLNLMGFTDVLWSVLMLFCFCKLICKSAYIPYLSVLLYMVTDYFQLNTYSRYTSPLPQEYGIIFILPAIYCGFAYFREQRRELHGSAADKSKIYLGGFLISFAMTLSVHFYGTIAAGFYALAMLIGFAGWVFRRPYFKKVMLTSLLSVVIALLPMGIAYATGTELEGSLRWALSVISSSD